MNLKPLISRFAGVALSLQPVFAFVVFLAVLTGSPPLWLAWIIALAPLPLRLFATGRISQRTPFDIPILISIVAMVIGFWHSPDHQLAITGLNTFLACVLLYYGIINNSRAPKVYWILWCVFVSLITLSLAFSIFRGGTARQVVFNEWAYKLAVHWPLALNGSLNVIGDICAVLVPGLVSVALFRQKQSLRWVAAILAAIFLFLITLSASGGGWMVMTAGLLFVLLRFNVKVFGVATATIVAAIGTLIWFRNITWVSSVFSSISVTSRIEIWQATFVVLKSHFLWGFGLGGWWSRVPSEIAAQGNPHNAYLQLYSDTGILGLIALIISIVLGIKLFWKIWRADNTLPGYGIALGIAAGVIAGGLHALVEVNTNLPVSIGDRNIYFAIPFLWIWVAFLVVSCRRLEPPISQTTNGVALVGKLSNVE